jgi:hypothetical protein
MLGQLIVLEFSPVSQGATTSAFDRTRIRKKTLLEPPVSEIGLELMPDVARQWPTLGCQVNPKHGIALSDDSV